MKWLHLSLASPPLCSCSHCLRCKHTHKEMCNLLTSCKVCSVGAYATRPSTSLLSGWVCFGLLMQFGVQFVFFPPYSQNYIGNIVPELPEIMHLINCLVSYLGPFTAPLCPSKTASGLVQTLSGNNRWLLYCLCSFTLEERLLKQMPLDRIQYLVNVPLGNVNWNGKALYPPTALSGFWGSEKYFCLIRLERC